MPRQSIARAPEDAFPHSAAQLTLADAPSGLSPHEEARRTLATIIAGDVQRRTDIATNDAAQARANDVLDEAFADEGRATKILTGCKAQSLMGGGFDWRESSAVIEAQKAVQDAQERISLARDVLNDLTAQREELDRAAGWSSYNIRQAVSAVVSTHPRVETFVAEAIERRRAWEESQQILGVLAHHFGPPFKVPGFSAIYQPEEQPRTSVLRETITRLHTDATAEFPA